jgi:hypothetical protein
MRTVLTAISLAALLGFGSSVTSGGPPAKPTLTAPTIECVTPTENTITLTITAAAPHGAPYGFSIHWTTCEALAANGGVWPADSCGASFAGNANGAFFALDSGESVQVTIGDLGSDSRPGVSWECDDDLLACGTCYAFRSFAHGGQNFFVSDKSAPIQCSTLACGETTCGTGFAKGDDEQTSVFYSGHGNPDGLDALSAGNGRWGWALNIPAADGETVTELWVGAGQNDTTNATLAGTVTITVAGDQVTVTYALDGSYSLDQVHIYANDLKPIAINGPTNQVKAPGGYGHTAGDPDAGGYSYTFTLTDTNGDGFWIIAHAVVCGVPVDQPDDE